MVMVSATEMIKKAHEGHYAIGAFNTNNLEWTKCILAAAEEAKAPVMIQASEGAAKYMGGYKMVVDLVRDLHDSMGTLRFRREHGKVQGNHRACSFQGCFR